jgi:hypothetical protein
MQIPSPLRTFRHPEVDELAIPPLKLLPPSLERGYTTSTTIIREMCNTRALVVNVVSVVLAGVPDHVRPRRNNLASDCFKEAETAWEAGSAPTQLGEPETISAASAA